MQIAKWESQRRGLANDALRSPCPSFFILHFAFFILHSFDRRSPRDLRVCGEPLEQRHASFRTGASLAQLDFRAGRAGRRLVVGGAAAAWLVAAGLVRADPLGAAGPPQGAALAGGRPAAWRRVAALADGRPARGVHRSCRRPERLGVSQALVCRRGHVAGGDLLAFQVARRWRRRPYCTLWLVGFVFWLATLHWLRFPHWATGFGWIAMSFYFAFYLPAFIALGRTAVHRLDMPVIAAAPLVWTGLELARADLLTGMTMASLGHTQYRWVAIIQIGDLAGAFGVGFLLMFVAACLARMARCDGARRALWPLIPAGIALAAALAYGHVRMSVPPGEPLAARRARPRLDRHADEERSDKEREYPRPLPQLVETGRRRPRQGRSDRLAGNDVPHAADHLRRELFAAGGLRRHAAARVPRSPRARAPKKTSARWATRRGDSARP